jgi:GNAT superfamily N-acetyltransferase
MLTAEPTSPVSADTTRTTHAAPTVLRKGTRDDAALLGRLHACSWQATYRGIMSDDFLDKRVFAERDAHWQEKMREWDPAHGEIWIAERDGEAIAFASVLDDRDPQYGVYLDHLHVRPECKGSGAGSLLIAAAERWTRERGVRQMHLLAWEANLPARGYYEHRGWYCAEKFEDQLVETRAIACRYLLKLAD